MINVNVLFGPPRNVDQAKAMYCAQFFHKDCGGMPVAQNAELRCSVCGATYPWQGKLADAVAAAPFKSHVLIDWRPEGTIHAGR